jgi:signal transduction histidine kinase
MQLYGDQQKRTQEANAITKTTVTLSDQINTPLNIILGNIELLQLAPELENVPKVQNILETMEAQIFKVRDVMLRLTSLDNAETRKYASLENYEMIDLGNGTDR